MSALLDPTGKTSSNCRKWKNAALVKHALRHLVEMPDDAVVVATWKAYSRALKVEELLRADNEAEAIRQYANLPSEISAAADLGRALLPPYAF